MDSGSERPPERQPAGKPDKHRRRHRGWHVLVATLTALVSDRCSIAAAGCAFYATLALFPAISTLVSIYGLVFNSANVESQLRYLHGLLPPPAFELIADRVHDLVTQPTSQLGIRLLASSLITFWSAASGTKSVLSALNVAYDVEEQRSFLRFQFVSLGLTLAAMLVAVLGIAVLVFIPVIINFIGLQAHSAALIHAAAVGMLIAFVAVAITVLYRAGPSPSRRSYRGLLPGIVAATLLWLVVSAALTFYVANLASFGATYGSLAAVVGIMFWFYGTVYAILLGAELNAQLDSHATRSPDVLDSHSMGGETALRTDQEQQGQGDARN